MQAILALEDGRTSVATAMGTPANARAKLFLILLLPDTRESPPILPMPDISSFSKVDGPRLRGCSAAIRRTKASFEMFTLGT